MSIFERWFGKSEEQKEAETKKAVKETMKEKEQEEAVQSFEVYAKGQLGKMPPEEREAFLKGRKEIKRRIK